MGSLGVEREEEEVETTYYVEIESSADKYLKECRTYVTVRFEAGLNRMTPPLCARAMPTNIDSIDLPEREQFEMKVGVESRLLIQKAKWAAVKDQRVYYAIKNTEIR